MRVILNEEFAKIVPEVKRVIVGLKLEVEGVMLKAGRQHRMVVCWMNLLRKIRRPMAGG